MSRRVVEELIPHKDGHGFQVVKVDEAGSLDRVSLPGPDQLPQRPQRAQVIIEGSYSDRAKGFSVATWQLSSVVAVAVVILSKLFFAYPLLSVATVAWLVSGYFVVWFGAFLLHTFVSAEGAEFLETWRMWSYLEREQRERHKRYGSSPPSSSGGKIFLDMVLAFCLLCVLYAVVLVIGGVQ